MSEPTVTPTSEVSAATPVPAPAMPDTSVPRWGAIKGVDRWVASRLGIRDFGPHEAIGVVLDGKIIAGIVYSAFNGSNIDMTICTSSPRWCTAHTLFAAFWYPFVQLGCQRVSAVVATHNRKARDLLARLGFTLEGMHPKFMPDGADAFSFGLEKADCKWIRPRTGKRKEKPLE